MKKKQSFLPRPEITVKTSSEESVGMSVDSENGEERTKNAFVDEEAGEDEDDIDDLEALWEEDAQSEGTGSATCLKNRLFDRFYLIQNLDRYRERLRDRISYKSQIWDRKIGKK